VGRVKSIYMGRCQGKFCHRDVECIAMSAYPKESAGNNGWGRSTEYLKNSMEIYSKKYYEYPWNSAVNVSGVALGMEYPGIIFCLSNYKNGKLWGDVTHEIGHNWFPMIVGSNERKYMWQDEGFNTFVNDYAAKEFNNGEYFNEAELICTENFATIQKQQGSVDDPSRGDRLE
jgi:aminopeptidase N